MAAGRLIIRVTACAAAMLATSVAPATAQVESGTPPESHLTLTVRDTTKDPAKPVHLTCGPAGGSHPRAAEACEILTRAGGEFSEVPTQHEDMMCVMILRPVTAEAVGHWKGDPAHYSETFSNSCVMKAHLGAIFDF